MTRELREATSFTFLTSQKVEFDVHIRSAGGLRKIRYDCSSGDYCLRLEGPVGGTVSGGTRIVDALVNPDVFEPEPDFVNPRYVGVVAARADLRGPPADHAPRRRRPPQPDLPLLAMRRESSSTHRPAGERGIGIIEVVVAAAVFLVVSAGVFAMLVNGETHTHGAEHHEAAISLAQREVERMRQVGYAELGMTANPVARGPERRRQPEQSGRVRERRDKLLVRSNFRNRASATGPRGAGHRRAVRRAAGRRHRSRASAPHRRRLRLPCPSLRHLGRPHVRRGRHGPLSRAARRQAHRGGGPAGSREVGPGRRAASRSGSRPC